MNQPPAKASTDSPAIPFLDLVRPHRELEEELDGVFRRTVRSASFVGGPEVEAFEHEFASHCKTAYAVGVSSGTDALRFAYMAAGLRPGQEVITVPNTFIATTEAITQAGGSIRFVDVEDGTLNMDPSALETAISPRTVGVVPVHLYGQPANLDAILSVSQRHGLWVVEDAAQAHGATYYGRPAGSFGLLGCFSFYPGKNLGACGEAGGVVTNDGDCSARIRVLRDHGQSSKYHHETEGYNGRLDAIQAAILRIKLRRLDEWNARRRTVAAWYRAALAMVAEVRCVKEEQHAVSSHHLFVIRAEKRDGLRRHLEERGIRTGLHYPVPLHLQPAYEALGLTRGAFPVAEGAATELLSLPMYPDLSRDDVERVAREISDYYH